MKTIETETNEEAQAKINHEYLVYLVYLEAKLARYRSQMIIADMYASQGDWIRVAEIIKGIVSEK
jgi:hypothetical protein